jgi:DNA (cytosine-5)-methyltransferase 1
MWRIIGEIQPDEIEVENSWRLVSRGLGGIITQLTQSGYSIRWATMGGFDTGSCTDGKRVWIYATKTNSKRWQEIQGIQTQELNPSPSPKRQFNGAISATWDEETDTRVRRDPHALAAGMERLKAIGNGQDPILAATAFQLLKENLIK